MLNHWMSRTPNQVWWHHLQLSMSRHSIATAETNIDQSAASITSCLALKFDASPRSRHFMKTHDFDNFSSLRSFVYAERVLFGTDDPARRSSLKCDTWKWHKLHQNATINSKWPTSCSLSSWRQETFLEVPTWYRCLPIFVHVRETVLWGLRHNVF